MNVSVLIVEDDIDLGNLLKQYLQLNGFDVARVFNGEEADELLKTQQFDILILDVMMPREDGFTFAARLRQKHPGTPFLFVTARKMKEDILQGLKLGADDYILKPFDADELILRIRNILKRTLNRTSEMPKVIQIGIYLFEPQNQTLVSPTSEKVLTEKESKLLLYLCEHPNQLIKRNAILDYLWETSDFFNGRSMDVFISRLRKVLAEDKSLSIESLRGIGFRFLVNNADYNGNATVKISK
jgi:DNA-binding response OmpR family regulator